MKGILGDTNENTACNRVTSPTAGMFLALSWSRFSSLGLTLQVRHGSVWGKTGVSGELLIIPKQKRLK